MAPEDIASCFGAFIESGKLRYWGVSKWPLDKLQELLDVCRMQDIPLPTALQEPHNYLFPLAQEKIAFAKQNKLELFLFSPLARGALTGKYMHGVPTASRGAAESYKASLGGMELNPHPGMERFTKSARCII